MISKETEIGMLVGTYQKLDTNAQKRLIGYLEALKELSVSASKHDVVTDHPDLDIL